MSRSAAMRRVETVSVVDAPVDEVWALITSPEGINYELRPIMRMTIPRPFRGSTIDDVEPGTRLGRSVLLLFGVLPFDYDDITIAELDRGTRFREESTMLSMSAWVHERTLRPSGTGTEVVDAVSFVPRAPLGWIPGSSRLLEAVLGMVFRHRHRRLGARFGSLSANR